MKSIKMPIKFEEAPSRTLVEYKNLSSKYTIATRDYSKQYCSIYLIRLEQVRHLLNDRINEKWGDQYSIVKLHKLSEQEYDKCIVIGTLFKEQKLKPSVLKQLSEANQLVPQPILTHFTDESDQLFIEDELQRYQLIGELKGDKLVTGITCALLGRDVGKGKFEVFDHIFPDYQEQIEHPILEDDVFVIFLSGLDILNAEKSQLNLQLLHEWLAGYIINGIDASKVSRVIIAGNSVRTTREKTQPTISMTSRQAVSSETIESVKLLDLYLHQFCELIDLDLMPGEHDPSNHILPQKQMHFCMFPLTSSYKTLNLIPNPYSCSLNGVRIMGTSGQPVRDIMRFSEIVDPLEALECCLKWNHLAPTAPDTLGCFPFSEKDIFVLEECPHVFFAGNQNKFGTKLVQGSRQQSVRLIAIPEFSITHQVCVLNLKNLDCFPILFEIS